MGIPCLMPAVPILQLADAISESAIPLRSLLGTPKSTLLCNLPLKPYLRLSMYLKGRVNTEFKHIDAGITAAAGTTPVVTQLTNISQGDTTSNRNGNSVLAKSIHINGNFQISAAATTDRIRLLLIKCNTDDTPTWNDIIDGTNSIDQFRNLNKTSDFTMLFDKTYKLTEPSFSTANVQVNIPLRHHVQWDAATTSEKQGHLWLLYLGQQPTDTATVNLRT